jgi:hypothetical protein
MAKVGRAGPGAALSESGRSVAGTRLSSD